MKKGSALLYHPDEKAVKDQSETDLKRKPPFCSVPESDST